MTAAFSTELAEPPELARAVLVPVRGHHAFETCVEHLGTAIRLGIYPHGSTLPPERELASRLAVSRATLREAIAALRSAGLVRTSRGRGGGNVVDYRPRTPGATPAGDAADRPDLPAPYVADVLVFRRVVEPGACQSAAARTLSEAERDFLTTAHEEVASAADPAVHRQADARFHLALATVTGSSHLVRAVTEVQSALHEMLAAIPVLPVNIEHSDKQHRAVLEAILRGDTARARRVMESHCDDTAALLHGLLPGPARPGPHE
ncbi:MAG: FadR/GntR family transcriptional regulator [Nocardioidaceae bacterium]